MTPTELMAALQGRGIKLRRVGDKLRFSPKDLMTPDLAALLLEHKAELLGLIADATRDSQERLGASASECLQSPAEVCPQTTPTVADRVPPTDDEGPADGWPDCDTIPIEDVELCPDCRRIEHWQDGLGNWKCLRCQPPKWSGQSLWNTAQRLRAKNNRRGND